MNNPNTLIIILVVALVTAGLRFAPFLIFGRKQQTPPYITYLSSVLPYSIMAMLVVYCLRMIDFFSGSRGIPEIISCVFVCALHIWKRNTLLSIAVGTVFYMVLIQFIL
ncbi:MAG: AzlD domain-containing protein [Blautia sp.]|nr:AzlD domain-containing protein [Blautia sp.]